MGVGLLLYLHAVPERKHPTHAYIYIYTEIDHYRRLPGKKESMLSLRQTARVIRPATRAFSLSRSIWQQPAKTVASYKTAKDLGEVNGSESLIGPGAKEGTIPTELEQATGLARLELLGKLEGIDVFDSKPLESSRKGTMANPIIVESYDDYRYVGCTGSPAGSHTTMWLKPTVGKVARCWECGSVYKVNAVGVPSDDGHGH